MTELIAENVVDPELRTWIMPDFSTTTVEDKIVASVLMMGAMQKYFTYKMKFTCGIPSVTLLGERSDWESILHRLEKLPQLGTEPTQFYTLLKPVLTNFVSSFDSPSAPSTLDFWQMIADIRAMSGSRRVSGWVTAFCFWDEDGKSLYAPHGVPPSAPQMYLGRYHGSTREVDGVVYHSVETDDIHAGYASVPVKVDDHGTLYDTIMVAGSVGIRVTSSGDALDEGNDHSGMRLTRDNGEFEPYLYVCANQTGEPGLDSLQPVSGWWMYETEKQQGGDGEAKKPMIRRGEAVALEVVSAEKMKEQDAFVRSFLTKQKEAGVTRA